jgi:hypothetical protein
MPQEDPTMSHEVPTMPEEQPAIPHAGTQDTAAQTGQEPPYEPPEEREEWIEDPVELPRRPRRRLLAPVPLALLGVLLVACGFIGGVLVEKGQGSSGGSTSSGGLAARFAALRGGGATGSAGTASGRGATSGGSGASAFAGGIAPGSGGATVGRVAYVSGDILYVTDSEGTTVKVTTSPASAVTKTVKSDVKGIHPGETVIVTGSRGTNGSIDAESVRVSEAGGAGLGAIFGGGGAALRGGGGGSSRAGGAAASGGGSGGEPALFGK